MLPVSNQAGSIFARGSKQKQVTKGFVMTIKFLISKFFLAGAVISLSGCAALASAPLSGVNAASTPIVTMPAAATPDIAPVPPAAANAAPYDWMQFGFDAQHGGNDTLETLVNTANAAMLHQIYRVTLPSIADGAPAYLSNVSTSQGVINLLFLTTTDGHILALNAASGGVVWSHQYGPNGCLVNDNLGRNEACYTTSSPAIDPNRQYVYSYGLDGYVHKYQVSTGDEVKTGGWPELATLKGFQEKGSSALSVATDNQGVPYLYVASAGYPGDQGDYQGHITAINLNTGSQKVFNTLCSNQAVHFVQAPGSPDCTNQTMSAVWARPGVIYDAANNRIYIATGNGTFDPANHNWGDSVLALNPDGSGANGNPLDSYTPTDFQQLDNTDADLGSSAPAILPAPAGSSVQNLALQVGKDGVLRLLNLANLSGKGAVGNVGGEVFTMPIPQGGGVLAQPAVWVNPADHSTWVFVANGNGISGLKVTLSGSKPQLSTMWQSGNWGTSPILANGVLFYAGGGKIYALNPLNGQQLWSATLGGGIHWESPIVDNGVVFITDGGGHLTAYSAIPLNDHNYLPVISR
jgi:outer membrane protein assembly factor BamB